MLFKTDFNNNNKWIGKQVMSIANSHQLAPEQYRSCKSKVASTQCLNKWLFYNLYHSLQERSSSIVLNYCCFMPVPVWHNKRGNKKNDHNICLTMPPC